MKVLLDLETARALVQTLQLVTNAFTKFAADSDLSDLSGLAGWALSWSERYHHPSSHPSSEDTLEAIRVARLFLQKPEIAPLLGSRSKDCDTWYHGDIDIAIVILNNADLEGLFRDDDGNSHSPGSVRGKLDFLWSKGYRFLPVEPCENFDYKSGCRGHVGTSGDKPYTPPAHPPKSQYFAGVPEAKLIDRLERFVDKNRAVVIHDGSVSDLPFSGIGLRPGSLTRTLREALRDALPETEENGHA